MNIPDKNSDFSILKNKNILLGVSSSVAIYKSCELISLFKKSGATVRVIETAEAAKFIRPELFEALTSQPCASDNFERTGPFEVEHIEWAKWADILVLAPATAHLIARLANGLADDRLTTTALACTAPVVFAPAMNTNMYLNPLTQKNIKTLMELDWTKVEPAAGLLACGDVGVGKLADVDDIFAAVISVLKKRENLLTKEANSDEDCQDLKDKKILITAGPTQEAIDPVRFISNHSSGKMGYSFAYEAISRGAEVCLISGPVNIDRPDGVRIIDVVSACDMYEAVIKEFKACDYLIMTAAVSDFRPAQVNKHKIKKDGNSEKILSLVSNPDILMSLKKLKNKQLVCGFAMETENLLDNGKKKLMEKNLDLICCNSLTEEGAGFGGDSNHIIVITNDGMIDLPMASKRKVAGKILDIMLDIDSNKSS